MNLPEPADGTKLVLHLTGVDETWPGEEPVDNEWLVIWRDDTEALNWSGPNGYADDERWFSSSEVEPRSLADWLSKARAVYALGDKLTEAGR